MQPVPSPIWDLTDPLKTNFRCQAKVILAVRYHHKQTILTHRKQQVGLHQHSWTHHRLVNCCKMIILHHYHRHQTQRLLYTVHISHMFNNLKAQGQLLTVKLLMNNTYRLLHISCWNNGLLFLDRSAVWFDRKQNGRKFMGWLNYLHFSVTSTRAAWGQKMSCFPEKSSAHFMGSSRNARM